MSGSRGAGALQLVRLAAVPLLAVLIGVGVAIASSPASLTRDHRSVGTTASVSPIPSPVPTPSPPVTQPGLFGQSAHIQAVGSSGLTIQGANLAAASADGGKTWTTLAPPANGLGVAIDRSNALHAMTGGTSIQTTVDGGKTWQPARTKPPGQGAYQPLAISPFDGNVWFFIHQGKLLQTRDATLTWRDLPGLPPLSGPVLAAGPAAGEFFLATGNRVLHLVDSGQTLAELPALPAGTAVIEIAAVGGGQATLLARTANNGLYLLKGNTWSALPGVTGGPIGAGGNGALLVGNGGAKLGFPGAVAFSLDSGVTWRQGQRLPNDQSIEAIAGQPGSATFYAYCYGGDVFVSADSGGFWTVLSRALRSSSG